MAGNTSAVAYHNALHGFCVSKAAGYVAESSMELLLRTYASTRSSSTDGSMRPALVRMNDCNDGRMPAAVCAACQG